MLIKIKEARDANDINQSLLLHNCNFNDARTENQWLWEYAVHLPEYSVFVVVCDKDRVVGTQGFIPIDLNVKGVVCRSAKSENSLLTPEYRKGTLFKELYDFGLLKCSERDINLIWGMTPASKVWRDKLGFNVFLNAKYTSIFILKPVSFLKRILKSTNGFRRILLSFSVGPLIVNSSLRWFLNSMLYQDSKDFSIERELRSFSDLAGLYSRLRSNNAMIHIEQDEKYVKWRLLENPNVKYDRYFVYQDGFLKAYCYLNTTGEDAYLTDFTFETDPAGRVLLGKVLRELHCKQCMSLLFTGNIENSFICRTFRLLKEYGFVKRKDDEAFVIMNLSYKNKEHLFNIQNWYINGLWTEGYTW